MSLADIVRKTEFAINSAGTRRTIRHGWRPAITPYIGYGDCNRVRVIGRVLMEDPEREEEKVSQARRGFRQFFTIQVPDCPVRITAGDASVDTHTNEGGYIDVLLDGHNLDSGWQQVMLETDGRKVQADVLIIEPDAEIGIVSDIDDTIMVTWLPRALIAAYNSWFLKTNARKPVPGMSEFYRQLRADNPSAPVFYLSTGAWNTFSTLREFLKTHGFPLGPMLLTDWGPTPTGLFRSGQEHKRVQLRNLMIDFPSIHWILIGDDGQHDPFIYGNMAAEHPDRIAGIGLRQLTASEHVLSHGSAVPLERPLRGGTVRSVPVIEGEDGFELLKKYLVRPFTRSR